MAISFSAFQKTFVCKRCFVPFDQRWLTHYAYRWVRKPLPQILILAWARFYIFGPFKRNASPILKSGVWGWRGRHAPTEAAQSDKCGRPDIHQMAENGFPIIFSRPWTPVGGCLLALPCEKFQIYPDGVSHTREQAQTHVLPRVINTVPIAHPVFFIAATILN